MLGIPGFNRSNKFGKGKILQGGFLSTISEYDDMNQHTDELITNINTAIQRPDRVKE
jgi:hypothetical protein